MNMNMKIVIALLSIFFGDAYAAGSVNSSLVESYEVDNKTQGLKVFWPGGSALIKGVVGDKGEITRNLTDFGGKKALHYENLASRSQFEAYLTVKRVGSDVLVDCVYGNIRSEQNGLLINKAVCGLDSKLTADYDQLIYKYSDLWKGEVDSVDISPLLQDPPRDVSIEEARIKGIGLVRVYKVQEELSDSSPTTIVKSGGHSHSFGNSTVFTVFNYPNITTPVYVEVVAKSLESAFDRLDYDKLNNIAK
ncbi:hypothetical protein BKM30_09280 [Pseudomonas syringae pv. syringae]|nr:hypothetical protein BKM27_07300 [Pseudomonas syringae pv. syringae]POR79017.1 hypothetical protein BKM30_09280 [Pseudomonas syringae pv. syringae]BBN65818.1 hypothetical protein KUIN1_50080 [Pseudomonas sp. KUIN-1]